MASFTGFRALIVLVTLLGLCNTAWAEIYRWVDDDGQVHFGDRAPDHSDVDEIKVRINSQSTVSVSPAPAWNVDRDVILYSTSWCGFCAKARQYFKDQRIPFTEYDVETSARGKSDFAKLGADGVPIIFVGGKRMDGFSVERFRELYDSPSG